MIIGASLLTFFVISMLGDILLVANAFYPEEQAIRPVTSLEDWAFGSPDGNDAETPAVAVPVAAARRAAPAEQRMAS